MRGRKREKHKMKGYNDLKRESKKMWGKLGKVILAAGLALGIVQ